MNNMEKIKANRDHRQNDTFLAFDFIEQLPKKVMNSTQGSDHQQSHLHKQSLI
jgi:hypothetical protein